LTDAGCFCAFWRTKEDVELGGVPPQLLDLMRRYGTLEQGKWNERGTFEYRYELNQDNGLFTFVAKMRGMLFVIGFAASDSTMLVDYDNDDDWIRPRNLLNVLVDPRFERRR
jgi:hypothetical protein